MATAASPVICEVLQVALLLLLLATAGAGAADSARSLYLHANQSGVWHCSMQLPTSLVPGLQEKTRQHSFIMHVLLRYTATQSPGGSKAMIKVRGMNVADVPEPPELLTQATQSPYNSLKHMPFDPPAHETDPLLRLWAAKAPPDHPGFQLYTTLSYPLGAVISGMPSYIEGSFSMPLEWGHDFTLTAFGGAEGQRCSFQPDAVENQIDPRGIYIDLPAFKTDSKAMPREAAVVLKPLFNMNASLAAALIDRHIQHYAMLGFTKYVAYTLPQDIQPLLSQPRITKWVNNGFLILLKWDVVPQHPGKPLWDQRVVYTHAVLAFLGRNTFLLMSDLDEYMTSLKPGLQTVFDMVRACTRPTDDLVNLQLTRFNILVREWPNRSISEQALWMPDTRTDHPVVRNSLINLKFPPFYKSMVNPNYIKVFFVHVASSYRQYNHTRPDAHCMILAHACNVNYGRENSPEKIASRFAEEPVWVAALERLKAQRQQWLQAGSDAAKLSGPMPSDQAPRKLTV